MASYTMVAVGAVVAAETVIASALMGLTVVAGTNPRVLNIKTLLLLLIPS